MGKTGWDVTLFMSGDWDVFYAMQCECVISGDFCCDEGREFAEETIRSLGMWR